MNAEINFCNEVSDIRRKAMLRLSKKKGRICIKTLVEFVIILEIISMNFFSYDSEDFLDALACTE